MGKKGKSKGGTAPEPAKPVVSTNAPIVIKEEPKIVKVEEPKVIEPVIAPKVEKVPEKAPSKAPEKVAQKAPEKVPQKAPEKIEKLPEKVEKLPEKIVKIEPVVESTPAVQSESPEGETTLSKSQKKRLRKKKSNNGDESEPKQDSPTTEQTENGEGGEKKKKHRKRKGNKSIVDVEEIKAAIQKKLQEIPVDAKKDDPSKKNKKKPQESAPAPIIEAPVVNIPEATQLAPESPTAARNGNKKNQKRAATSSNPKTSIPDELKIKQEQDQQKAREELQKEIESREKLLEKIEQVLDSRKGDVEAAVSQQNILGKMGKELTKIQEQKAKLAADVKAAAAAKIQSPKENELVKKIERVVDVTKIEIENVQNQQAFVGQLEAQLAKVKNTKDKYMRGDHSEEATSSKDVKLPPHIEKLKQEIVDIKKGKKSR